MSLSLDPQKKYNIYAKGRNTAECCLASHDPSREDVAALYCLAGWGSEYPAEAPIITEIAFVKSGEANRPGHGKILPLGENTVTSRMEDIAWMQITAISKNPISDLVGPSDIPMWVGIDGMEYDDLAITKFDDYSVVPYPHDGQMYWSTTYSFHLDYAFAKGRHWLSIVVYDMASNRTEQRVYLNITDKISKKSDPNLSAIAPGLVLTFGVTYGVSINFPLPPATFQIVQPVDDHGASYFVYLYGIVSDIRGFEVWRSTDNVDFNKIDTVYFIGLSSEDIGFYDCDPKLVENVMYYYKIRAFNSNPANGGYSQFSNTMSVKLLPAFTTKLTEPPHRAISQKLYPTFKFELTNPLLFDREMSDHMVFALSVWDPTGVNSGLHGIFYVDFLKIDEKGNPSVRFSVDATNWHAAQFVHIDDNFTIAIDTAASDLLKSAFRLHAGATYEWAIWGHDVEEELEAFKYVYLYGVNTARFYKKWPRLAGNNFSDVNVSFSFGSTPTHGFVSPNGLFTLTIAENAK
jgi:hypothetical protein